MINYNEYDGIVNDCKMWLTTDITISDISKKLKIKKCLIYRINDAFEIRKNISKFNKYEATLFYELTILNKDMSICKKDIMFIMKMTLTRLNNIVKGYGIMDVNAYRSYVCSKLVEENKLSAKEIGDIVHYAEASVYRIKEKTSCTKIKLDKNTFKKCMDMLKNNIDMTKLEIADELDIDVKMVDIINSKYGVREYKFRKVISESSKNIYKLLKKNNHDVKIVMNITGKSETAIRDVMLKYDLCSKQQLICNRVLDLLADDKMTMVKISNTLGICVKTVYNINSQYGIRCS